MWQLALENGGKILSKGDHSGMNRAGRKGKTSND